MNPETLYQYTKNKDSITALFPKSPEDIEHRVSAIIEEATKGMQQLLAHTNRTFDNTIRALDTLQSNYATRMTGISVLSDVSPDAALRTASSQAAVRLQQAAVDLFDQNKALYNAVSNYYATAFATEMLTPEERYYVEELMQSYKRNGLDLPDDKRAQVITLTKELGELSVAFMLTINSDASYITATFGQLNGVNLDVVEGLSRTEDGLYKVTVDYPTYHAVIEHCTVADTRKRLYKAYQNRAYPQNKAVLDAIIKKRDQLAKLLGYQSYAHLNIDNEMARTPERAYQFVNELLEKAHIKSAQEFAQLKPDLAPSVALSEQGKMFPWNKAFAATWFKKKQFNLDEREVSDYFPMQQTIDRLLDIYQTFFDIRMKQEPIDTLWIKDLTLVTVYAKNGTDPLGYLVLDLYPREHKYGHACEIGVSPALLTKEGKRVPAFAIVLTNFPKPTITKPALLPFDDVQTFFHEFGHAIHEILGATHLALQAGTRVKTDFVELPSQMLEEWLYDKDILKQVSGHYVTGAPLPEQMIDTIIALKNFGSGSFVQAQCNYALLALGCFGDGEHKDVDALRCALHEDVLRHTELDPEGHFHMSFGHLDGYGARYYGYLWSKVYALDLFAHIKKSGLLNPKIGTEYARKILGKGGSNHPMELIKDFLGREPNQDAFMKDLGLD